MKLCKCPGDHSDFYRSPSSKKFCDACQGDIKNFKMYTTSSPFCMLCGLLDWEIVSVCESLLNRTIKSWCLDFIRSTSHYSYGFPGYSKERDYIENFKNPYFEEKSNKKKKKNL